MSLCVETLVTLRSSKDRALKVYRAMLDPIGKLKADCPEIQ
jgi:hypothetical protein